MPNMCILPILIRRLIGGVVWIDGWIPEKYDKTDLFWSVLTIEPPVEIDKDKRWHGKKRHWITANSDGLKEIERLQENPELKAIYFSQGLYWRKSKSHGKSGVGVLPWCWVDLDVYNTIENWDRMSWQDRTATMTESVMSAGLPFPTLMVSSGRGAYMVWKLKDPVWNVSKKRETADFCR